MSYVNEQDKYYPPGKVNYIPLHKISREKQDKEKAEEGWRENENRIDKTAMYPGLLMHNAL
jgi:hypothetical protein